MPNDRPRRDHDAGRGAAPDVDADEGATDPREEDGPVVRQVEASPDEVRAYWDSPDRAPPRPRGQRLEPPDEGD